MDNATAHPAAEYDRKVRHTIPFYELLHSEVIDLLRTVQPQPKCWVDTGCGTGRLARIAITAFPQTRFILADPSEAMLSQVRARFGKEFSDRLTLLPATDSAGLGSRVQASSADVVTAIQCHHYLQPAARRQAVQACFELLRPGGLFVEFENISPRTSEGTRIGLKRWKAFQLAEGRPQPEVDKHLSRFGTEVFPITAEQHVTLLNEIGFRTAELFWFSQMQAGFYGIK